MARKSINILCKNDVWACMHSHVHNYEYANLVEAIVCVIKCVGSALFLLVGHLFYAAAVADDSELLRSALEKQQQSGRIDPINSLPELRLLMH